MPSRIESIAFIVTLTIATAAVALGGTASRVTLPGCTYFVLICTYVALWHSARLLVFVYAVMLVVAGVLAVRLLAHDPILAIVELLFVVMINVGGSSASSWLVSTLGMDVRNSDTDFLTGLLNRRAFHRRTGELIDLHRGSGGHYLAVVMIDLDRFKQVNDTHGHVRGDQALIAIAQSLRATTSQDGVVARVGGEEFLVADVVVHPDLAKLIAERIRAAIIATPPHLTASVGATSAPMTALSARTGDETVARLIEIADTAMYLAKRSGGNRFRYGTL
ncbi:MAG: GGDEF domain-containing protein [Mycobacterium sp.]|nr:GGDEF domain-containing protein [Mycobacterium sp.]